MARIGLDRFGRSWRRWVPWEGRASLADYGVLLAIGLVVALGLVTRPVIPFLIARDPLVLELLTGDLFAVGIAAAFARIGSIPLWAVVVAGVVGMVKFDWIMWWAGRRWGEGIVRMVAAPQQAQRWSERARRADPRIIRGAVALAWLPGVPSAIVFAIAGLSGMPVVTFLLLDACGAVVLTVLVGSLGFGVGQSAVDTVIVVDRYAAVVSLSIIVLAIAIPLARGAVRRSRRRDGPETGTQEEAADSP